MDKVISVISHGNNSNHETVMKMSFMLAYRARVERRKTRYFGAPQAKNTFMLVYRARVERRKTQYFGAPQAKNAFMLVYRARVERHKSQCFGPPQAKNLEFMQSYFLGNNFFWSYFLEK